MENKSEVIELHAVETNTSVQASLVEGIREEHIICYEKEWKPFALEKVKKRKETEKIDKIVPGSVMLEDFKWDWKDVKQRTINVSGDRTYAIEYRDETQGLMWLNLLERSKISSNCGLEIVYIELIATAPWNRSKLVMPEGKRFGLVGENLLKKAVEVSEEVGFKGRIGLHSLPQSESYYRDVLQMKDFGPDNAKKDMHYFELEC